MLRDSAVAGRGATRWRLLLSSMLRQSPLRRGVLQQVGADGYGQGLGGFGRFGSGFALQDAGDVFFAVQAGDEFVVEQKQFAVAVDIQLVAVGEFDAVVALQWPGRNNTIPGQNAFEPDIAKTARLRHNAPRPLATPSATRWPAPDRNAAAPFDWYRVHPPRPACHRRSNRRIHPAAMSASWSPSQLQVFTRSRPPKLAARHCRPPRSTPHRATPGASDPAPAACQHAQQFGHRNPSGRLQRLASPATTHGAWRACQYWRQSIAAMPNRPGSKYNPQDFTSA